MEIIARGKTPDGYNIVIQDWEYPEYSPLTRYTTTAYTPSKKHDPTPFAPTVGETYCWMFKAKNLDHAKNMFEQMENGTPPSEFKDLYTGEPKYKDFI